ncbi:MAG: disulfide bond formation protein B [Sphingomonadales bacterium]|nr:disulfide bond formation protein B [Sphingomonadales bacterium]
MAIVAIDPVARRRLPAALAALVIPALLWGGALISQYGYGLRPCEMCYWQRWPHEAAIVLAMFALALLARPAGRWLIILAALAIAVSGAIGVFHAGVEYGWWEGLTRCASARSGPIDIMNMEIGPLVRCDEVQWSLAGISLAGFNALFSLAGAALVLWLLRRGERAA